MADSPDAARRAAERARWPGLKTTLAAAPGAEDLRATTTAEERLAMMWELALASWALTGQPLPTYSRANMPGKVLRPGSP